ncbi:hypothetical protein L618_006000000060 [Rhodococcus rhodochrous J45]|uniref:DUF2255 family protein n=1 Tax=Rhodococcus rhodochrous J45 TaxID=935266 RepID=A0A562DHD7_RHORH|nr:DUF2255 family protein [Rhodococcus rhodochrous]TWH08983.1 hypothetical protein L618_006000000060 [Rhodococcus rhodochrous J45]
MTNWTKTDLTAIDRDGELHVAAYRLDGTLRTSRIVWHVVVDDALYIRSVRGIEGAWYRGVQRTGAGVIDAVGVHAEVEFTHDDTRDDAIDAAYRDKYGTGPAVRAITSAQARATTLRVEPR